jgi:hypothetical protein
MPQELLASPRREQLLAAYCASTEHTYERVGSLLAQYPPQVSERFSCYLLNGNHPHSAIARAVECQVFNEFFGNDPQVMLNAYGAYDTHSLFFLIVDSEKRKPAGTLRVIEHSPIGLKTLNDIAQAPLHIDAQKVIAQHSIANIARCWDIGTLAVTDAYRGPAANHIVSTMLYGFLHAESLKRGIEHIVTILDQHTYHRLTKILSLPFVPIARSEPFSYLGSSSSVAAYVHTPSVRPTCEQYLKSLSNEVSEQLGPHIRQLIYGERLPGLVAIS